LVGEGTIDYMYYPEVSDRIYSVKPQTKFIFIFRNPVDRAFSHFWQGVKNGKQKKSWEYLIENDLTHKVFNYSFYYAFLVKFLKSNFDFSKIHIVIFEDFVKNPQQEYEKICNFLNISYNEVTDIPRENKGFAFKNIWIRANVMKVK